MPKMRTEVPYQRPSIHSKYGHYYCGLIWTPKNFISCHIKIDLVWFNRMGWYHSVNLESHWDMYTDDHARCPPGRNVLEFDHEPGESSMWTSGEMLPLCAKDADTVARQMIEARGLVMPKLPPYVLYKSIFKYGEKDFNWDFPEYKEYLNMGIRLNDGPDGVHVRRSGK